MYLYNYNIAEVSNLIKKKEVSPVDITRKIINEINLKEHDVNAYITVTSKLALKQAFIAEKEILRGNYRSELHGIPISIKDNIYLKGIRNTNGSKIDKDFIPSINAPIIDKLLNNGAIIIGKTNLHEYAKGVTNENKYFGSVKNPLNLKYISGGSSGGSAASVSSNTALASIGTDTGGSVRIPASCCGLVGFKPTYNTLSTKGVTPLSPSFDHIGPITKTIKDSKILLKSLMNKKSNLIKTVNKEDSMKNIIIGIPSNYFFDNISKEVKDGVELMVSKLKNLEVQLTEVFLPHIDEVRKVYDTICNFEAANFHKNRIRSNVSDLDQTVLKSFKMGRNITKRKYIEAHKIKHKLYYEFKNIFKEVDFLMTPTLPILPPKLDINIGEKKIKINSTIKSVNDLLLQNTMPFNITGFPSVSIPVQRTSDNLSVGLQITADYKNDLFLLKIAHLLENQI